jgi:hypothetical protein
MRELQYIKTDKNGTKYYHDWNCPRCGGEGYNAGWRVYGSECFACRGKGISAKPRIVKEYLPEYKAKLEAKAEAKRAEKVAQIKAEGYLKTARKYGFDENGVGYVYTGNTYAIREELRTHGAKFSWELHWVSPRPIMDFECIEIAAADVFDWLDGGDRWDLSNQKCEAWRGAHGLNW